MEAPQQQGWSSSSSSPEKKKNVYLRVRRQLTTEWYILELNDDGDDVPNVKRIYWPRPLEDRMFCNAVALGSSIFYFGGCTRRERPCPSEFLAILHQDVSYFDTEKKEKEDNWCCRIASPMNFQILRPKGTAHGGKVYFFRPRCVFVFIPPNNEFDDGGLGVWDSFSYPEGFNQLLHYPIRYPVASDPFNDRILVQLIDHCDPVFGRGSLFAYYPNNDNWECLIHPYFDHRKDLAVVVDGVLLILVNSDSAQVSAYCFDESGNRQLNVVYQEGENRFYFGLDTWWVWKSLLYLGNHSFLIARSAKEVPGAVYSKVLVEFLTFTIQMTSPQDIIVSAPTRHSVLLDADDKVEDYLLL